MKISKVDAIKIDKLLRERSFGDIYLSDFYNLFGKTKYKNEDYLEYYTSLISDLLDKDEIQYKHFNKYLFLLFSFFEYDTFKYNFDGSRIKELHNKYRLFLDRTKTDIDTTAEEYFSKMDEILDKNNCEKDDNNNEEKINEDAQLIIHGKDKEIQAKDKKIAKLEEKEQEKKETILKLRRTIKKFEKEVAKLNESIEKKDIDFNKQKERYDELVEILEKLKLEHKNLQEEYTKLFNSSKNADELFEKNKDLKEQITELKISLESLAELENEFNVLKTKLDKKNQEIETLKDNIRELKNKEDSASLMLSCIINILYEGPATLKEIDEKLIKKGIHYPKSELYKAFSKLSSMVNVDAKTMAEDGPLYEITEPLYARNRFYDIVIPEEDCYIDLLLTADYHIFDLRPDFYRNYEALGEYAEKNNIRTILNLGDFFDFGISGYQKNLYQYRKIKESIDYCIEKIPYIPNTIQFVLGGNHDVWNMYLGYDFLKYFIDNRMDYLSLGYENANLIIKKDKELFKMLLLHTNRNLERNNLKERIDNINNGLGIKQKRDMYVFGHSHESYLDLLNSVCVVPSLTVDKICNGAWHIRIYLDDLTISYKPLAIVPKSGELSRKLVPTSEIIYKK